MGLKLFFDSRVTDGRGWTMPIDARKNLQKGSIPAVAVREQSRTAARES